MQKSSYIFNIIKVSILEQFQYKVSLIIAVLSVIIDLVCTIFVFILMFDNFENLNGWGFFEIILLYSLYLSCHGVCLIFSQNMWGFPYKVMSGEFDYMCTKPKPILVQTLFSSFSITALFYFLGGMVGIIISLNELGRVNLMNSLVILIVVLAGAIIEISITILIVSLSFKYYDVDGMIELNNDLMNEVLGYPLDIYNGGIKFLFTFLYPIAFISYYPVLFMLQKGGFNLILIQLSIAINLFCFSIYIFNRFRKKYQGIGG